MTEQIFFDRIATPLGAVVIVFDADRAIAELRLDGTTPPGPAAHRQHAAAAAQLQAYFNGELERFALVLKPRGTPFQQRVWHALQQIPYGAVVSYGELARRIGKPGAARAVGQANGANPIPIIVPCHRVIGGGGKLGGYSGGLDIKTRLLALEGSLLAA